MSYRTEWLNLPARTGRRNSASPNCGFVVKSAGYNVGFLILAAMPAAGYAYAVVTLVVFWFYVPETKTGVNRKASRHKNLAKS
ncbi:hypothetical protein [Nostoc sp.]|uniref:hypothetical protein n=1 Tax=Nostoc sp. TaxID=1180 RepID=UPI002FFCF2EC